MGLEGGGFLNAEETAVTSGWLQHTDSGDLMSAAVFADAEGILRGAAVQHGGFDPEVTVSM